jgi:hypothetical protein
MEDNDMNIYSRVVLTVGVAISLVSALVRLNARSIAWPRTAGWGGPIEVQPFYAAQLAIADVSNLLLAFGLALVASVFVRELFRK